MTLSAHVHIVMLLTKHLYFHELNNIYNLIGATSCVLCEPGYYQEKSGESSCIACSAGTYTDKAGMDRCLDCPGGKFSNTAGKKNMTVSRNFITYYVFVAVKLLVS